MRMYKVCPDYMSSGLMKVNLYDDSPYLYLDQQGCRQLLTPDTYQLLSLCQQIFDQTDSWSSEDADYKFPNFISRKQYEILCWLVARRVESETGVTTIASFYWENDNV